MIERYSRPEMSELWSEEAKYAYWGQVERAHLEGLTEKRGIGKEVLAAFDHATESTSSNDYIQREQ
jgi:adenylosuccinate lyase